MAWVGAVLAGLVAHQVIPPGGLVPAVLAFGSPMDPAAAWPAAEQLPGPVLYWSCTLLVVVLAAGLVWWRRDLVADLLTGAPSSRTAAAGSSPGMARWRDLRPVASRRAVQARAAVLRPASTTAAASTQPVVGYRVGSLRGRGVWCTVEDSVLVVGPPRMGKGVHVVIPWVLDAPGAVVATSTRPDSLAVTLAARRRRGPVAVFDPQQLAGLPGGLAWSPVRGCEEPRTALVRARGLAAGAGWGASVTDAAFWAGQTETTLRCLLHAAALEGRRAGDVYRWSLQPTLARDAVRVLTRHRDAADGWADALDAVVHADPRTRDSVWLGVRQALASLADPRVLAAVDPEAGEGFDPARFLTEAGTLFLLAPAVTSASSGPLVAAFVEDVTETARRLAAASVGARLDPPVLLALDEIANLTPLPSLPALMAEGGGSGITTVAVLQSLAQARHRWGEHAADVIWDAATVKLVLGGLAHRRDLDDVTRLLGEIDEPTPTISRGRGGERATSTSLRQVPVMSPAVLRTLPFGTAVLLLRHTPPAVVSLQPWTARPDAAALATDRAAVEDQIRRQTP
jgi:type IV secretory pathway TraG/TraD family ATPase VirD4